MGAQNDYYYLLLLFYGYNSPPHCYFNFEPPFCYHRTSLPRALKFATLQKKNALLAMGRYGQTVGGDMCNVKT